MRAQEQLLWSSLIGCPYAPLPKLPQPNSFSTNFLLTISPACWNRADAWNQRSILPHPHPRPHSPPKPPTLLATVNTSLYISIIVVLEQIFRWYFTIRHSEEEAGNEDIGFSGVTDTQRLPNTTKQHSESNHRPGLRRCETQVASGHRKKERKIHCLVLFVKNNDYILNKIVTF